MRALHHLEELEAACTGGVCVTIGVFDAVHRGHQMLIELARDQARMRSLQSLVFTFERHPLALIAPAYCPPTLTQPGVRTGLFERLGVDVCLMLRFTPEVAAIGAEDFIDRVLVGQCGVRFICCGWNFTFGARGEGKTDLLKAKGAEHGFDVEICAPLTEGASAISSTRVRDALIEGHVGNARALLHRSYGFDARVVTGDGRGREIGYPTANLEPPADQLIPADGVYAVSVCHARRRYGAMLNVGSRPTFDGAGRAIEAHLFDFSADLVGETLWVEFLERVRDERKFDGVKQLLAQLKKDEATCREICRTSS